MSLHADFIIIAVTNAKLPIPDTALRAAAVNTQSYCLQKDINVPHLCFAFIYCHYERGDKI